MHLSRLASAPLSIACVLGFGACAAQTTPPKEPVATVTAVPTATATTPVATARPAPDPPTTPDCAVYTGPGDCQLDTACRWLVPGCASKPQVLAAAGCYPAADCVQGEVDSCPAGQACTEVLTDPCWNSMCDACGARVYVCR
jgi:hypothetical protein